MVDQRTTDASAGHRSLQNANRCAETAGGRLMGRYCLRRFNSAGVGGQPVVGNLNVCNHPSASDGPIGAYFACALMFGAATVGYIVAPPPGGTAPPRDEQRTAYAARPLPQTANPAGSATFCR